MTKNEFKDKINHMLNRYTEYQNMGEVDKAIAEDIRQHDPVLADLLLNNVNAAEKVFNYLFEKTEVTNKA